jgi:hypothetical protein
VFDLHGKEFMQIRVSHRRRQVIPERASAEGVSGTCFDLAGLGQLRWRGVRSCAGERSVLSVGAQTVEVFCRVIESLVVRSYRQ